MEQAWIVVDIEVMTGLASASRVGELSRGETESPEPPATIERSHLRGDQPTSSVAAAAPSIIYLGMDVHKDAITIAVLPHGSKSPTHLDRLPNDLPTLERYLER
jgi:hypothetical protein